MMTAWKPIMRYGEYVIAERCQKLLSLVMVSGFMREWSRTSKQVQQGHSSDPTDSPVFIAQHKSVLRGALRGLAVPGTLRDIVDRFGLHSALAERQLNELRASKEVRVGTSSTSLVPELWTRMQSTSVMKFFEANNWISKSNLAALGFGIDLLETNLGYLEPVCLCDIIVSKSVMLYPLKAIIENVKAERTYFCIKDSFPVEATSADLAFGFEIVLANESGDVHLMAEEFIVSQVFLDDTLAGISEAIELASCRIPKNQRKRVKPTTFINEEELVDAIQHYNSSIPDPLLYVLAPVLLPRAVTMIEYIAQGHVTHSSTSNYVIDSKVPSYDLKQFNVLTQQLQDSHDVMSVFLTALEDIKSRSGKSKKLLAVLEKALLKTVCAPQLQVVYQIQAHVYAVSSGNLLTSEAVPLPVKDFLVKLTDYVNNDCFAFASTLTSFATTDIANLHIVPINYKRTIAMATDMRTKLQSQATSCSDVARLLQFSIVILHSTISSTLLHISKKAIKPMVGLLSRGMVTDTAIETLNSAVLLEQTDHVKNTLCDMCVNPELYIIHSK